MADNGKFEGKLALVTGASKGIGNRSEMLFFAFVVGEYLYCVRCITNATCQIISSSHAGYESL